MIVAATQSQVRSVWHLVQFLLLAGASLLQAKRAPGNRGATVRPTALLRWHTKTVWSDEATMAAYVRATSHAAAMRQTGRLTDWGRFARFEVAGPKDATWERAFTALSAMPQRSFPR